MFFIFYSYADYQEHHRKQRKKKTKKVTAISNDGSPSCMKRALSGWPFTDLTENFLAAEGEGVDTGWKKPAESFLCDHQHGGFEFWLLVLKLSVGGMGFGRQPAISATEIGSFFLFLAYNKPRYV